MAPGSCPAHISLSHLLSIAFCSVCSIPEVFPLTLLHPGPGLHVLGAVWAPRDTACPHGFPVDRVWAAGHIWQQYWHTQLHVLLSIFLLFQLKVDEFASSVNEIKDPYPSADFPGETCPWKGSRKAGIALQRDAASTLAV